MRECELVRTTVWEMERTTVWEMERTKRNCRCGCQLVCQADMLVDMLPLFSMCGKYSECELVPRNSNGNQGLQ